MTHLVQFRFEEAVRKPSLPCNGFPLEISFESDHGEGLTEPLIRGQNPQILR